MQTIYLDNNATTQPCPEAIAAMREALEVQWANPSSIHRPGQAVRQRVEAAHEDVAALVGARGRDLFLTSGGSEAAMTAIRGSLASQPARSIIVVSELEHHAVRDTANAVERHGADVRKLRLTERGTIDLNHLQELLQADANNIALVAVMWANNETGVLQPIEEVGRLCRGAGVRFFCDATQAAGKMPVDVNSLEVDLLCFSGHKFHGPKGIGAMYVRPGVRLARQMFGGPQERERRGGTENVPGIFGLAAAARVAKAWLETDDAARLEGLRNAFEERVLSQVPKAMVIGKSSGRVWNTSNIAFHRLEAEAILLMLSERGVCASAGSACSSGSLEASPVIRALNIGEAYAHGACRFSLGKQTTQDELGVAADIVAAVVSKLNKSLSAV